LGIAYLFRFGEVGVSQTQSAWLVQIDCNTTAGGKMKVEPLKGDYCPDCAVSLTRYRLEEGSIVPMCREDLHQFLNNGDYQIASSLISPPPERGTT
jgi:hypothetical protein